MEKSDEIVKLLHNILETLQNVDNKLAKMEDGYTIKNYLNDIESHTYDLSNPFG